MLDRTIAPPVQPLEPAVLLSIESIKLNNAVPTLVLDAGNQAIIKIEWQFEVGKVREKTPGAAYFTAQMLKSGTGQYSAQQIAETLARYGASLSITPHLDYSSVTLITLTKFADTLIPFVSSLLWESNFPKHELERQRIKKTHSLKVDLEKTSYLASISLRESLYGKDHAYGKSIKLAEVEALQREDLVAHHKQYFHAPLAVFVSGKVAPNHIQLIASGLAPYTPHKPEGKITVTTNTPQSHVIKKPGVQATIRVGKKCIPKTHKDYHHFRVTNEILGGYFGSRLMQNLREDKGLTYGIYSSIMHLDHSSYQTIGADVPNHSYSLALQEIKKEVETLSRILISEEELNRVKSYLQGRIISALNSPLAHMEAHKALYTSGLTTAYFDQFFKVLEEINAQDIQRIAQEQFEWSHFTQVVVGVN